LKFYLHFLVNLKFYLHFCGNLKFCHFQSHIQSHYLITAATNSVCAIGIGTAGKGKKRIFLCAQFPPRGEAGDVRIWGGGALSKASSRTCRRRFLDCGSYQFCVRCREGKKRIFLCARFPPCGEAGDVRIWGGHSPRPPLELVVADFLIAAATNSVRTAGIGAAGKEKKESFCAHDSHLVVRLAMSGFGGGRSPRPPLEFVVSTFFIAAATDSCALAVSVRISSLCALTVSDTGRGLKMF
jgi:hypothetical protein